MTDRTNDIDPAERVRRLQARRAASGRSPSPAVPSPAADRTNDIDPAGRAAVRAAPQSRNAKQRRRHPAAATRWLLGGLSIASFFGIAGTVAAANVSSVTASAPATATQSAPGANALASGAPAAATPVTSKATGTAGTTAGARTPHTTTRGS